jgi:monoterpene epsilon-lactone hydrolase
MGHVRRSMMISAIVIAALTSAAHAQLAAPADPGFSAMEAQENAANGKAGPRTVPGRAIPVPDTVSPQLRASIAAPYRVPAWDADPKSAAEWKELISKLADAGAQARREAREKLGVTMEPTEIGGVKAFILTPKEIPPENRNRLLIHVHGGGYVYNPGEAGASEGMLMAAYGGFKVISIDYRMPPDFPYPAAMDDGHGGLAGSGQNEEPAQHGDLRHFNRWRYDARHDFAGQAGEPAVAGRHRARDTVVRSDRDRRHLQDQ